MVDTTIEWEEEDSVNPLTCTFGIVLAHSLPTTRA